MNKRVRPKGLGSFFVWWLFKATAEYNERKTIGVAPVPPSCLPFQSTPGNRGAYVRPGGDDDMERMDS